MSASVRSTDRVRGLDGLAGLVDGTLGVGHLVLTDGGVDGVLGADGSVDVVVDRLTGWRGWAACGASVAGCSLAKKEGSLVCEGFLHYRVTSSCCLSIYHREIARRRELAQQTS